MFLTIFPSGYKCFYYNLIDIKQKKWDYVFESQHFLNSSLETPALYCISLNLYVTVKKHKTISHYT